MQTPNQYMLFFRGDELRENRSAVELETMFKKFAAWYDELESQGKVLGGNPLEDHGKVVTGSERTVTDGPFAEAKESVGGYFLLNVTDGEEALAIAKTCPGLDYGQIVEVRQIASECPISRMAREAQELAAASA